MGDQETILVLDRDREVAKRIGEALSSRGFRMADYASAADAVRFASERRPIAAFVDVALASDGPGSFLNRFRALHPFVPVVVTTNAGESADLLSIIHFGVNEHLVKPFKSDDVRELFARALREDQTGDEKAMIAISARLRETRRRLGLKQAVVAIRTGLSVAQISQIENRASTPSLASLLRICKALRTPISEIVAGI